MTYNSKQTISSLVAGVILIIAYVIFALQKYPLWITDIKACAISMLIFIGIGVACTIVMQIVFHIVFAVSVAVKERDRNDKEVERIIESSMVEDERDKLINLKSAHVGYGVAGAGFIGALITLAVGGSMILAIHILYAGFALGSFIEGIVTIYLNERGVRNG